MSLLHDVLKPNDGSSLASKVDRITLTDTDADKDNQLEDVISGASGASSDDELIGVVSKPESTVPQPPLNHIRSQISVPGTPNTRPASRAMSGTSSPRTGAASRRAPGPLHISSTAASAPSKRERATNAKDPLRVLTTDLNQRIFSMLPVKDLASAARVCRKWSKSQSLNYRESILYPSAFSVMILMM